MGLGQEAVTVAGDAELPGLVDGVVAELEASVAGLAEELELVEIRYDADRTALEKAAQLNMEFIETDTFEHPPGTKFRLILSKVSDDPGS